jgi:glycosyltransferase involved in cell wall biosynthesis
VLYSHADATIAVSAGVRASLLAQQLIRPENIYVIPNPIPLLNLSHEVRQYAIGKPMILACGRLEFQKDHATLLRAFARLRQRLDAKLVILGEGSLRDSLEDLTNELGIEHDVVLAGFDPDPYRLMRTASVFVHTARYEGFGVVLLEALASGCPVVATDCPGGVREVLADGKFGALVPVGDDKLLAETMELILTGELAFPDPKGHLRMFDLDLVADAYLKLLIPQRA